MALALLVVVVLLVEALRQRCLFSEGTGTEPKNHQGSMVLLKSSVHTPCSVASCYVWDAL